MGRLVHTVDLENPGLPEFLYLAYIAILAWEELIHQIEQALKRVEGFLKERFSKPNSLAISVMEDLVGNLIGKAEKRSRQSP